MRLIYLFIAFTQLKGSIQVPSAIPNNILQNTALPPGIYELKRVSDGEANSIKPNQIINVRQNQGQVGGGFVGPVQNIIPSSYHENLQQNLPSLPTDNGGPQGRLQQFISAPHLGINGHNVYQPKIRLPENIQGYQLVHNGEHSDSGHSQGPDFHINSPIVHVPPPPPQNDQELSQHFHEQDQQNTQQNFHINPPPLPQNNYLPLPHSLNTQNQHQIPHSFHFNSQIIHYPSPSQNDHQLPQNLNEQNQHQIYQRFHVNLPISHIPIPSQNIFQLPANVQGNFPTQNLPIPTSHQGPLPAGNGNYIPSDLTQQIPKVPQHPLLHIQQHLPPYPLKDAPHHIPELHHQLAQQSQTFPSHGRQHNEQNNGYHDPSQQNQGAGEYFETVDVSIMIPGNENLQFAQNHGGYNPLPQQQDGYLNNEGYQVVNEGPVNHIVSIGNPNAESSVHHPLQQTSGYGSPVQPYQNHKREASESTHENVNTKHYIQIQN